MPPSINTSDIPQEGVFGSENLSSAYLEPVTSEEEIDYSKVYALFTFVASMEGQISVLKGEPLDLLDDSNSYWWAVKCISTDEIGYIPAENIETPFEKLARFNRTRNVDLTAVKNMDLEKAPRKVQKKGKLQFATIVKEIFEDGEIETELPPVPEKDAKGLLVSSLALEDETFSATKNDAATASTAKAPKVKKASFIDRMFGRKANTSSNAKVQQDIKASSAPPKEAPAPQVQARPQSVESVDRDQAPINVLRVFASPTVKFNATFKSVSFDKNTLISDLVVSTIRKFRVRDVDPKSFYLTVTPVDVKSTLGALGERVLLPDENINKVLDTYGVLSYVDARSDDGKAKQADGTVKITIYKYDDEEVSNLIPIRICRDDVPNSWEKLEVDADANAAAIIVLASERYQIPSLGVTLLDLSSKTFLDPGVSVKSLAQEAAAHDQMLTLKLFTRGDSLQSSQGSLSRVSRLDPGRPNSFETLQSPVPATPSSALASPVVPPKDLKKPFAEPTYSTYSAPVMVEERVVPNAPVLIPRVEAPTAQIPAYSSSASSSKSFSKPPVSKVPPKLKQAPSKSLGFDEMLDALDAGIKNPPSTGGRKRSVVEYLQGIESEIESLILSMVSKSNDGRRKSRLSALYYKSFNQEEEEEADTGDVFLDFKATSSELTRLESKLNGMVAHLLLKNGILIG